MSKIFSKQRGLFLVLFVITLAVLMAVVIFGNSLSSIGKRADASAQSPEKFAAINAALTQFLQLNLRLPCPAAKLSATGREDTASSTDTATCLSPSGVVPWTTLGLTKEAALDGWSRMISYRVYDAALTGESATKGFTRTNGLNLSNCLDSDVSLGGPPANPLSEPGGIACNATTHENTRSDFFNTKGLSVSDRDILKTQIVYALISHGETGYGSKESLNANAEGTYWILDPSAVGVAAEDVNHFDDVVSYAVASDLVVAAKVGGRAWPVGMVLDRTDANWPASSPVQMSSPKKIVFNGGPIMTSAFRFGAARNIASIQHTVIPPFYTLGVKLSGGSGNLENGEGLGFDFKVKRRVLKVVLESFNAADQATFTFYNGATQVGGSWTKSGCDLGADFTNFTIPVGNDFTKAEILAPTSPSASFSVASIAACKYDDATCILPDRVPANDCP